MPPGGTTEDENAGGPRSVGAKVTRRRTRKFIAEYENEHDDEENFQESLFVQAGGTCVTMEIHDQTATAEISSQERLLP